VNRENRTPRLPVAARRVIIRACIAIGIAELALQAVEVRVIHHSAAVTFAGVIVPVVTVLSGLFYLRSTKGKQ
jgi:hypothetical protein